MVDDSLENSHLENIEKNEAICYNNYCNYMTPKTKVYLNKKKADLPKLYELLARKNKLENDIAKMQVFSVLGTHFHRNYVCAILQPVHVVHWAGALAKVQHGFQCTRQVIFCVLYAFAQRFARRKVAGNGRG